MGNVLLACLIITTSIVIIWDYFNAPQEMINQLVNWWTGGKITSVILKKPYGCSLCLSFYTTLIVLLCFNWKLAPMALVFAWSTPYILTICQLLDKIVVKILTYLNNKLDNE